MKRIYKLMALLICMLLSAGAFQCAFASEIDGNNPATATEEPRNIDHERDEDAQGADPSPEPTELETKTPATKETPAPEDGDATREPAEPAPTKDEAAPTVKPHRAEIISSKGGFVLDAGEEATLSLRGEDLIESSVRWTSLSPRVVYVSGGMMIGVSAGTAQVRAEYIYVDGDVQRAASVTREVVVSASEELTVSVAQDALLNVDETAELTVELKSARVRNVVIRWFSSDPDVVVVEHGSVRAIAPGSAVITACCEYVESGARKQAVYSYPIEVSGLRILGLEDETLQIGTERRLSAELVGIYPDGATYTWSTSDAKIVELTADGQLTAVGMGNAQINVDCAYMSDGQTLYASAFHNVAVREPVQFEIRATDGVHSIAAGEMLRLTAKGWGADLEGYSITWNSWDDTIAEVDANGYVLGISEGDTIIEAVFEYLSDGEAGTCVRLFDLTVR